MKAISLPQPGASLLAHGEKRFDTKAWRIDYTGPVAIHALADKTDSQRQTASNQPFHDLLTLHGLSFDTLPFGAIIATARIVAVHHSAAKINTVGRQERKLSAPWHTNIFMYEFADVVMLETPIPVANPGEFIWDWDDTTSAPEPIAVGPSGPILSNGAIGEPLFFTDAVLEESTPKARKKSS